MKAKSPLVESACPPGCGLFGDISDLIHLTEAARPCENVPSGAVGTLRSRTDCAHFLDLPQPAFAASLSCWLDIRASVSIPSMTRAH